MIFNSAPAFNPMDRDYEIESEPVIPGTGVGDIGMSVPLGIAAGDVQGVDAIIRQGTQNIEIQFAAAGRGNRQGHSPGMWGKEHRQALEELSRVNDIELTTHASFQLGGLAGQDQQGSFSDQQRKFAVDEVKRAIDFAADTAKGGSVVVHTGEFTRPISEQDWAKQGNVFSGYEEEPEKAHFLLIDDRTGQAIQQVRKNQDVPVADWRRYDEETKKTWENERGIKEGMEIEYDIPEDDGFIKRWEGKRDKYGNHFFTRDNYGRIKAGKRRVGKGDYLSYDNKLIIDPLDIEHGRLPEYDEDSGRIKISTKGWDHFVKEADEWNNLENRRRKLTGQEELSEYERVTPEERWIRATMETNEGYARGWALNFSVNMKEQIKTIKKIKEALNFYEKLEDDLPEEEKWKIMKQQGIRSHAQEFLGSEYKTPAEILKKELWEAERNLAYFQETAQSQEKQSRESREQQMHIKSANKYALQKSFQSYAESGMHAFELSQKRGFDEKPLMITMENIFPEQYGGHPDELRHLVEGSRERMVEILKQKKGMDDSQAKKYAETHIKATLDTGHLNIWRKYWQGNDEDFNRWMIDKAAKLAKDGIIGNVHLSDNFGYQDEHLAPGLGNAPVKEMVKAMKENGYKGPLTVEPGAHASTDLSAFHGTMKTWSYFGSPIYGVAAPMRRGMTPQNWGNAMYSSYGQIDAPPNYIVGAYVPSNEWSLWSNVQME